MQLINKIPLDIFDFNKYLMIGELPHVALCNIDKYFPGFSYFAIISNKSQNMRNWETISHIALGTVL